MTWPRLTLAHVPVFGAIACTIFFNASYAYGQAGAHEHRAAMVALAVTIDLAKATFLPAAAHYRAKRKLLGPALLVALWLPALAYSTFAGYAYLTTTRALAKIGDEAQAGTRARVQADYDRTTADLATAKSSPDWTATGACTRPRTPPQRTFCTNVADTEKKLAVAARRLDQTPPTHVNPEVTALATVTGWPVPTVGFWVALFPAVLIELVAGLGLYALRSSGDASPKPLEHPQSGRQASPLPTPPPPPENPSNALPSPADAISTSPRPKWKRSATP